jgi:Tol biopolymer transport system component
MPLRHHSTLRANSFVFLMAGLAVGMFSSAAHAQSIMDRLKAAAQKAAQQPGAQQAPRPAQPVRPGQPAARPGQPAPAGAPAGDTGPFTPPAGTKVDILPLGPLEGINSMAVSPRGVHVAINSQGGSRPVILYDGVAGPKMDRILPNGTNTGVVFSPDGNHYAYCGGKGNTWTVFLDGNPVSGGTAGADGNISEQYCTLYFTGNSKHLYFTSMKDLTTIPGTMRIVFDGKPGPYGNAGQVNFTYSPDGNHIAYPFDVPEASVPSNRFIVDYQIAPYTATGVQFSGDGQHIFSMRSSNVGSHTVVDGQVDGKAVIRADHLTWFPAPVGTMAIAVVGKAVGPAFVESLVVNGKLVPGSETLVGGHYGPFFFSPDGLHYASIVTAGGRQYVFTDGKKHQDYPRIDQPPMGKILTFTADSSKLLYLASNGNGPSWLVVNGEESPALRYASSPVLSPAGGHYLIATHDLMMYDGKQISTNGIPMASATALFLSFSPDGNHYAFVLQSSAGRTLFLDGVPNTAYTNVPETGKRQQTAGYEWSPDSKHIAYVCHSSNPAAGNELYACIDNKTVPLGGNYGNMTFSADSNHIFWVKGGGMGAFRVFVDGKPVYEGTSPDPGGAMFGTWEAQPDGSVRFLAKDATSVQRVSITPSPSTSVASLIGGN